MPFSLPLVYPRIRAVQSFEELIATPFADGVNALCWPRKLSGDFGEIVAALHLGPGITALEEDRLKALGLSAAGQAAREVLLQDQQLLHERGLEPVLNGIDGYPRDTAPAVLSTDVYSFHVDRAEIPAETWLCTYHGAPSEGLSNEEALRHVDHPGTRRRLLEEFGGEDDHLFQEHLAEHCYDLHYAPLPGAHPFSFGLGNLWRIAIAYSGSPVPPCIHRAPATLPGDSPRLLLIS